MDDSQKSGVGAPDYTGKRVLIFEGQGLVVYARMQAATSRLVVTFNGRGDTKPNREGQGEGFFEKYGVSAIHFISTDNHWWQSEDFERALAVAKSFAEDQGVTELITYGSSMGGYGALAASGPLNALRVIAITPQFTVDPEVVPWDKRFLKDARKLTFVNDDLALHMANADIVVISDPYFEIDQRHVELIAELRPVRQLRVPFAEHDVAPVMVDCGLLSRTILELVQGDLDFEWFRQGLRKARNSNWCVIGGASRVEWSRGRKKHALALGSVAYRLMTAVPPRGNRLSVADRMVEAYAMMLDEADKTDDGLAILEAWTQLRGGSKCHWLAMLRSAFLEKVGKPDKALEVTLELLNAYPNDRKALPIACRLIDTENDIRKFYETYSDACLKYPGAAKALGIRLRQLGAEDLLQVFAPIAVDNHPAEARKLRAAFGMPEPVNSESAK